MMAYSANSAKWWFCKSYWQLFKSLNGGFAKLKWQLYQTQMAALQTPIGGFAYFIWRFIVWMNENKLFIK